MPAMERRGGAETVTPEPMVKFVVVALLEMVFVPLPRKATWLKSVALVFIVPEIV